jgi:hypothetical protein
MSSLILIYSVSDSVNKNLPYTTLFDSSEDKPSLFGFHSLPLFIQTPSDNQSEDYDLFVIVPIYIPITFV